MIEASVRNMEDTGYLLDWKKYVLLAFLAKGTPFGMKMSILCTILFLKITQMVNKCTIYLKRIDVDLLKILGFIVVIKMEP